jgi:hypothetical protein
MRIVTLPEMLDILGSEEGDVDADFVERFNQIDFAYEEIKGDQLLDVILGVLRSIDLDSQVVASSGRADVWRHGWQENLNAFLHNRDDLSTIIPKYIRPNQIIRYKQKYIRPRNPFFERDFFTLFQMWFFRKYMRSYDCIYEFGSGSGMNIVPLAKMFPHTHIVATDFVQTAIVLAREIASYYHFDIDARLFDMIRPDHSIPIRDNSCIFTCGSVEQLGGEFNDFVYYLIDKKPAMCLHIEPIIEFYDESVLADYLVIKFVKKRGYSQGFFTFLKHLEEQGHIEILKKHRTGLGSLKLEGYNYIVWRPIG